MAGATLWREPFYDRRSRSEPIPVNVKNSLFTRKKLPVNANKYPCSRNQAPCSRLRANPCSDTVFLTRLAAIGSRADPARMFGGRSRPLPVQRPPVPCPGRVRSRPGAGSRYGRRRGRRSARLSGLGEDAQGRKHESDREANRGDPVDHRYQLRAIRYASAGCLRLPVLRCRGARWVALQLGDRRGFEGPAKVIPEMSSYP